MPLLDADCSELVRLASSLARSMCRHALVDFGAGCPAVVVVLVVIVFVF